MTDASVNTLLYPIVLRRHVPVTLFIHPSAISHAPYALTWTQIRTMAHSGLVDVQSHTHWHPDFRRERAQRSTADYQRLVDLQLQRSQSVPEAQIGTRLTMLAWPYGIVDTDLEAAAARTGWSRTDLQPHPAALPVPD